MSAKTEMQNLVDKDPVLKAFLSPTQPKNDSSFNNSNEWVALETNLNTLENMEWTTARQLTENYPSAIAFLIVKKYNAAQSKEIFNALKGTSSTSNASQPPIHIDVNGDLTIQNMLVGGKNGTTIKSRYTPDRISGGSAPVIHSDYIKNNMFSWSESYYMSTNCKYILIKRSGNSESTAKYVLVFNPIHSYNFKRYYQYAIINNDVASSGIFNSNTEMRKSVIKYCNALVVPGRFDIKYHSGISGQKPDVYLDPLCGALVDDETTRLNKFYTTNITSWYYRNKFYNSNDIGKKFTDYIREISVTRELNRPFTCQENIAGVSQSPVTLYKLLRLLGQTSKQSETFLYDLAIYTNNPDKIPRSLNDFDKDSIPECSSKTAINICEINIYASGAVYNNNFSSCKSEIDTKNELNALANNSPITSGGGSGGSGGSGSEPGPRFVEDKTNKGKEDKNKSEESYKYIIIGVIILVVIIILGFILFGTFSTKVPTALPAIVPTTVPTVSSITTAFGKLFN